MVELSDKDCFYISKTLTGEMMKRTHISKLKDSGIHRYYNGDINTYEDYYTAVTNLIIEHHEKLKCNFHIIIENILENSKHHNYFFSEEIYPKYIQKILNYVEDRSLYRFLSNIVSDNLHSYENYLKIYKIYGRIFNKNSPVSEDEFNTINQNIKDFETKHENIIDAEYRKYYDDDFYRNFSWVSDDISIENDYIQYYRDEIPENYILKADEYYDNNGNIYNKRTKLNIFIGIQMDKYENIYAKYIDIIMRKKLLSVYN